MDRSRADRILADWDSLSGQAPRPAMPRQTVVTTSLPGISIVGIAVLVLAIAVAGVWFGLPRGDGSPGAGASASPTETWGPLAVVPASGGVDEALATGTLHITDTCVFLEEAGDDLSVLVWPADRTTWDPDQQAITLENLNGSTLSMRDGDRVRLGGGGDSVTESGVSGEEWVARTEWVATPASSCPMDARWFVGEVVTDG
ncbi:MAG: hypothetical protein H0U52_11260 [Chloroflexi bacterium]|nr:hypothetical protein [Chloroflexota bacterium]